jgi:carboxymethylenebutenolidase
VFGSCPQIGRLFLLFVSFFLFSIAALGLPQTTCSSTYRQKHITILGKLIEVELFSPPGPGRHPVVLMIHGQAGLFSHPQNGEPTPDNFGEHFLPCYGIVAVLVHYFDISGIRSAPNEEFMRTNAPMWLKELRYVVDWIVALPNVNHKRIALLGESLGGYLAIALGLTDKRIHLVSAFSSGDPRELVAHITNHPLIFLYHGSRDSVISMEESTRTCRWLAAVKAKCHLRVFEGLDHGLDGSAHRIILNDLIMSEK